MSIKRIDYWNYFAQKADKDHLAKDLNASWNATTQKYLTHSPIPEKWLRSIKDRNKCLDFGIGLGRNYDYLNEVFGEVIGYDIEVMLNRLSNLRPEIKTNPNWNILRTMKFDFMYECTVFQHKHCRNYLGI